MTSPMHSSPCLRLDRTIKKPGKKSTYSYMKEGPLTPNRIHASVLRSLQVQKVISHVRSLCATPKIHLSILPKQFGRQNFSKTC
jgi:hypothetical protein